MNIMFIGGKTDFFFCNMYLFVLLKLSWEISIFDEIDYLIRVYWGLNPPHWQGLKNCG